MNASELPTTEECEAGTDDRIFRSTDFERLSDAQDWSHRESTKFDTDDECQAECERLLRSQHVEERDGERWFFQIRGEPNAHGPFESLEEAEEKYNSLHADSR